MTTNTAVIFSSKYSPCDCLLRPQIVWLFLSKSFRLFVIHSLLLSTSDPLVVSTSEFSRHTYHYPILHPKTTLPGRWQYNSSWFGLSCCLQHFPCFLLTYYFVLQDFLLLQYIFFHFLTFAFFLSLPFKNLLLLFIVSLSIDLSGFFVHRLFFCHLFLVFFLFSSHFLSFSFPLYDCLSFPFT